MYNDALFYCGVIGVSESWCDIVFYLVLTLMNICTKSQRKRKEGSLVVYSSF